MRAEREKLVEADAAAMEAVHASGPPPAATYADSVDSLSPHSRGGGDCSWDEPFPQPAAAKLRLMCSYGGQIVPRPHDRTLCYLGGETRIVAVDRHSTLADLHSRLSRSLLGGRRFSLKYQLPSEDLDSLISVSTDEDLDNMVDEYDRIAAASKPARLRLFLFPASPSPSSSIENSLLDGSSKSETWFVDALNGAMPLLARNHSSADSAASSVNCLLGLDDSYPGGGGAASELPSGKLGGGGGRQEVQSMPDSPMLETASSFGSASSAPSLSSLPPIRVRPEDDRGADPKGAVDAGSLLEEQFCQMNISGQQLKPAALPAPLDVEGFKHHLHHFPPPPPAALAAAGAAGEAPAGISPMENPKPQQSQQQLQKQVLENSSILDVPISGDAASRSVYGQEMPPNALDPNQQETAFSDPGYGFRVMEQGYLLQPPSLPVRPMRAVEQLQQQAQQQQGAVQHLAAAHHHATGAVLPISSYYNQMLIHPQQQLPPVAASHPYSAQVPLYLLPIHHGPTYNLPVQAKLADAVATAPVPSTGQPTIPRPSSVLPPLFAPAHKQEVPTNVYRTAVGAAPALSQPPPPTKLIHLDPSRQYVGYHPLHHPTSQSASVSRVAAGYGYEYVDPVHAYQMYYAPAASATLPPQYQMMSAGAVTAEPPLALQQPTDAKRTGAS